jgi:hypothetical protein
VLLPVPDEGPALTNYQEAGQLPGVGLSLWVEMIFGEKSGSSDSKTGRYFCIVNRQKLFFAYFLSPSEAKF